MPNLTVHLLLDPREGRLRLGGKEGAILVSALPRRNCEDRLSVLRYLSEHPGRRRFQLVFPELVLEWRVPFFSATPHGAIATLYN